MLRLRFCRLCYSLYALGDLPGLSPSPPRGEATNTQGIIFAVKKKYAKISKFKNKMLRKCQITRTGIDTIIRYKALHKN